MNLSTLHKTATQLLSRRTRVEVRRCSMNEVFLTQKVIGFKGLIQISGPP